MRDLVALPPSEFEAREWLDLLTAQRAAYRADPIAARTLAAFDLERFAHGEAQPTDGPDVSDEDAIERAATAVVASALLGLDAALTRR